MTGHRLSKSHAGKQGDSIPWKLRGMIRHLVAYPLHSFYRFTSSKSQTRAGQYRACVERNRASWYRIYETENNSQARNAVLLNDILVDETIGRKFVLTPK